MKTPETLSENNHGHLNNQILTTAAALAMASSRGNRTAILRGHLIGTPQSSQTMKEQFTADSV